jgi:nucleotide-binding universal stress UspA family protein
MGKVVVGYVPKAEGEAALDAGIAEAKLRNTSLIVVSSHRGGGEHPDAHSDEANGEVAHLEHRLGNSGVEFEIRHLARGFEPAEDLLSIAEASGAELIVIGMRKRSPVGKLIMGSNAQRVLLDSRCPVLTVKAD